MLMVLKLPLAARIRLNNNVNICSCACIAEVTLMDQTASMEESTSKMTPVVSRLGFWSAVLSFVFGVGFIIAELADLAGATPHPQQLLTLMFPSFLLTFAFVILMASVYQYAPQPRKIWAHIGLIFAVMYATLNSAVYMEQMTVLYPLTLAGTVGKYQFIAFGDVPSFIYGLNALGYGLMSLATLFVAPVFAGPGLMRWIRGALIANGLLAPALLLQQNILGAFYVGALWIITFPVSTALLALFFKRVSDG